MSAVRRPWLLAALALLAVVAAAGLFWFRAAREDAAPPLHSPTLAVLAFQPADATPGARLFADGLAISLAGALSRYDVTVVSTSSSLQLTPAQKSQAHQLLGADFVIDGRVSVFHGQPTISAQISDARKNILVDSFDVADGVAPSNLVADRIAKHLALTIDPDKFLGAAVRRYTPADYALIARVNNGIDGGDITGVIAPSRELAARYPDDGELQAVAGVPVFIAASDLPESQRAQELRIARADIERGGRLAPNSGVVSFAQALLAHGPLSLATQERRLRRAAQLNGAFAPTFNAIGELELAVGRTDDGVALLQRSVQLDPMSNLVNWGAARGDANAGRAYETSQALARAEASGPESPFVQDIRYWTAAYSGAPQDLAAFVKAYPKYLQDRGVTASEADLLARAQITRDLALVRASIDDCFAKWAARAGATWNDACLFMMVRVGALDDAFRFAQQSYPDTRRLYPVDDDRWLSAAPAVADTTRLFLPGMAPFRNDPRFWSVALRTGLVDYWRASGRWPDFCRGQMEVCKARAMAVISGPGARLLGN